MIPTLIERFEAATKARRWASAGGALVALARELGPAPRIRSVAWRPPMLAHGEVFATLADVALRVAARSSASPPSSPDL